MEDDPSQGARRKVWGLVAGLVLVTILIGTFTVLAGGEDPEAPPSEAEARAFFDRVVAAARMRDWDGLCNLNGAPPNCRMDLDSPFRHLRDTLPPDPPTVVETRLQEKQSPDGTDTYIVVAEGTDGRGRPYRTEVGVFRDEGKLQGINVVYWSGHEIFNRERNERRLRESEQRQKG